MFTSSVGKKIRLFGNCMVLCCYANNYKFVQIESLSVSFIFFTILEKNFGNFGQVYSKRVNVVYR